MKRGAGLELDLVRQHDRYRKRRLALVVQTHPEQKRIKGRHVYTAKGPVDFMGCLDNGIAIGFDAKETKAKSWPFKNLELHQAMHLESTMILGGVAGLVVRWTRDDVTAWLGWEDIGEDWWRWYEHGGKPASIRYDDKRLRPLVGVDWYMVVMESHRK